MAAFLGEWLHDDYTIFGGEQLIGRLKWTHPAERLGFWAITVEERRGGR